MVEFTPTDVENEARSWADHVIQNVTYTVETDDDTDLGNTGSTHYGIEFEPTAKQLNNSELAELVYMRRHYTIAQISAAGSDNHESVRWKCNTVINGMTGGGDVDEFPTVEMEPRQTDDEILDGRGAAGISQTDNPGVLDHFYAVANGTTNDEADGLGGGAASLANERDVHFRDLYGRGPVVDANDHIALENVILWNKQNGDFTNGFNMSVDLELVWDVHEIESARPLYGL